jgi:hypothetical protein
MRSAFHFDSAPWGLVYGTPIEEATLAAANAVIPPLSRHLWVKTGDLILGSGFVAPEEQLGRLERLLDADPEAWHTVRREAFERPIDPSLVFVIVLSGLDLRDARRVDEELTKRDMRGSYLGALEVNISAPVQWAVYEQALLNKYRIIGTELRLFYSLGEEDHLDVAMREHWESTNLFSRVAFEALGARGSIFDPYSTLEHARLLANLEDRLGAQLATVANEIILRMGTLDPALYQTLAAAFSTFDQATSSEQLAQVALSCRRLLEQLADVLEPASERDHKGHSLGKAEYRNRLWAFADIQLGGKAGYVLASIGDVGQRIDRLDALANRGIHGSETSPAEVQRLLAGLVALVYDLLTLAPPPNQSGYNRAYEIEVERLIEDQLEL